MTQIIITPPELRQMLSDLWDNAVANTAVKRGDWAKAEVAKKERIEFFMQSMVRDV